MGGRREDRRLHAPVLGTVAGQGWEERPSHRVEIQGRWVGASWPPVSSVSPVPCGDTVFSFQKAGRGGTTRGSASWREATISVLATKKQQAKKPGAVRRKTKASGQRRQRSPAPGLSGGVLGGGTSTGPGPPGPSGLVPRRVAAWSPAVVAAAEALVLCVELLAAQRYSCRKCSSVTS